MNPEYQLTAGAISRISTSGVIEGLQPIVQLLDFKRIGNDRFRVSLSDGECFHQAMLATQFNDLVMAGNIANFFIVRLREYVVNIVGEKRVFIVVNMDVLDTTVQEKIGTPMNFEQMGNITAKQENENMHPNHTQPQQNGYHNTNNVINKPSSSSSSSSRPTPSYMNTKAKSEGPVSSSSFSVPSSFHDINSLNPYQNRWTIKARVTAKSEMRTWQNQKSSGNLFSVDLLDASGGQIKATMFKEAADKFFNLLRVDGVYIISKGQLKLANSKFNTLPNQYEMTLNADAEIMPADDDQQIQQQKFNFTNFQQISSCQDADKIDIIGVVTNVGNLSEIVAKQTQKQLTKRTITLTDNTNNTIDLTLWGETAKTYNESELENNPILAIKAAQVKDFSGGRSLSASFSSLIFVNPDRREAHDLKNWWTSSNKDISSFKNLSLKTGATGSGAAGGGTNPRMLWIEAVEKNLGNLQKDKADYFVMKGTIIFCKADFEKGPWYLACVKCQKKVREKDGEQSFCDNCNAHSEAEPRYILNMLIGDFTGGTWATAFSNTAEIIVGMSAKQAHNLVLQGDRARYMSTFQSANFKEFMFTVRARMEHGNDDPKVRYQISNVAPVNFVAESKFLIDFINQY